MRRVVQYWVLLAGLFFAGHISAQGLVSETEWKAIIHLLETEQWPQAEKMTQGFLKKAGATADTSYEGANLRYMYLVSVAAQLGHKSIEKAAALKKTKHLVGKVIITPGRTVKADGLFNHFKVERDSAYIFCCQSNNDATEIEIFEFYKMGDANMLGEVSALEGKSIRLMARIASIEAEGYAIPRLKVHYNEAIFEVDQ